MTQFEAATAAAFVAFADGRGGGGGHRGGARRAPRRDQRAAVAGDGADLDRHRAHRVPRRDRARDRRREARRAARALGAGAGPRWIPRSLRSPAQTAADRRARVVDASTPWWRRRSSGRAPYLARNLAVAVAAAEEVAGAARSGDRRRSLPPTTLPYRADGDRRRATRPSSSTRLTTRTARAPSPRRIPDIARGASGRRLSGGAGGQGRGRASSARWPRCSTPRFSPRCRHRGCGDRAASGTGSIPASELASIAQEAGVERARGAARSRRPRSRARRSWLDSGAGWRSPPDRITFWAMDREARSELLHMMGLVAAVVAIVILVFFGLGYLFGRAFL